MDSGLLWTAVGSAAGVLAAALAGWQIRLQLLERRELERSAADPGMALSSETGGLPVAVPLGRLPAEVRGRDALLAELRRSVSRRVRRPGGTWVLAGMGGLGKSTVALATAEAARAKGWRVWWVTATDNASLTGGMLEILHQLAAPEPVIQLVREGAPTAADRAWAFLEGAHQAGRRWLLILDNADAPAVLAAYGAPSPADHTGWLRSGQSGMVIVTTRVKDPHAWGPRVRLRELRPLDDVTAGQVLVDLAPAAAGPGSAEAQELGHRLGGLPLALYLVGSYLSSPFARWHNFADYRHALDSTELPAALADLDDPAAQTRATIQQTWDISVDALAASGRAQARPLLLVLSCYAPATPVQAALLRPELLAGLPAMGGRHSAGAAKDIEADQGRRLREALRGLAMVGLIDITASDGPARAQAVTVHPVVADANRSRLLTTALSDLPGIGEVAVRLLQTAAGELDYRNPADWPAWAGLVPHLTAMLEWLAAHLDADALAALLHISGQAGEALRRTGNLAAAEKLARSSVEAASRLGDDNPAGLTARHTLAAALAGRGRASEAEQTYRQVLADQRRVLGEDHPDTLLTRHNLAWEIEYQGRYKEAEQLYRQVLADGQRVLGDDHPDTLSTGHRLARVLAMQGRHDQAEQLYRQVLADGQRVRGDDHPDTLSTGHRLAEVLGMQGRYDQAEQLYRQVLADQRRVLGDNHPDTLVTRREFAVTAAEQGRHGQAEQLLRQELADRRRELGDRHPGAILTRHALARVLGMEGRYDEAEQLCRQALTDQQQLRGADHPNTLATGHTLGQVIAERGGYDEAEQLYRHVLTDRQRVLGNDHPDTLATRDDLAKLIATRARPPADRHKSSRAARMLDLLLRSRQPRTERDPGE